MAFSTSEVSLPTTAHPTQDHQADPTASTLDSLTLQDVPAAQSRSESAQTNEDDDFGDFSSYTSPDLAHPPRYEASGSRLPAPPRASAQSATETDTTPEIPHREWSDPAQYDSDEEALDAKINNNNNSGAKVAPNQAYAPDPHHHDLDDHDESLIAGQPKRERLTASDPSVDPDAKPTIVFAIPFPETPFGVKGEVPPFCVYTPPAKRLVKPDEGQKEGLMTTVQRKWQESQHEARTGPQNFRNKAMGYVSSAISWTKNSRIEFLGRTPGKGKLSELRILYPPSMPAEDLQSKFSTLLKAVRAAAIRNGVISTAILPLVFVFDTLTFIPGPFEVNTAWAVASWTGAARASSITNSLTNETVPISFHATPLLDSLAFRLAELCKEKAKPDTPTCAPVWKGEQEPMRGVELAAVTLAAVTTHIGLEAHELFETDLELLAEDIEEVLAKGANEWLEIVQAKAGYLSRE